MKLKIVTFLMCNIFIFENIALAGSGASAFLGIPVGARAGAMGGAAVAIANDASSVYWNPASLGSLKHFAATTSMLSIKIGDNGSLTEVASKQLFLAAVVPAGKIGVFGIAWSNFSSGDIEFRSEDTKDPESFFNDSENAWLIGYGYAIVPNRMNLGLTLKYVQQKLYDSSASGKSFSLGMTYQAAPFLKLALRADDDFSLKWEDGYRDQSPFRGIAGLALSLWKNNLIIALDLEQSWDRPLKANSGVELNYQPQFMRVNSNTGMGNLTVRAGMDDLNIENRGTDTEFQKQTNFTYGFGMGFQIEGIQLNLDYSFGSYRIGNQNRFTLSLFF